RSDLLACKNRQELEMKIPEPEHSIAKRIYKAYEDARDKTDRYHLGVSLLGNQDERYLWLKFRWAFQEHIDGRILKLFERGHREEDFIVKTLKMIGVECRDTGKEQITVRFGSHVSGSMDGTVLNVPGAEKTPAILECKTHSDKSFKDLVKNGVQKSKFQHYVQCCVYAYGRGMSRALYYAVNKNTDEVYTEWLHVDNELAERYIQRGQRIALSDRMPEPLTPDPTDWRMKF